MVNGRPARRKVDPVCAAALLTITAKTRAPRFTHCALGFRASPRNLNVEQHRLPGARTAPVLAPNPPECLARLLKLEPIRQSVINE